MLHNNRNLERFTFYIVSIREKIFIQRIHIREREKNGGRESERERRRERERERERERAGALVV